VTQPVVCRAMAENYPRTLMELEKRFDTDEACRHYLFVLRWPNGFVCPRCGGPRAWPMARGLWLCGDRRYQHSRTGIATISDAMILEPTC
jgi:hypothetical protein